MECGHLRVEGQRTYIKEWCEQNGINLKTYYYYLRRIRDAMLESSGPRLVEMKLPAADFPVGKSASPDDFLPRITITLRAEAVVVFGISGVQSM